MLVILATQEAEIRRIAVRSQPGQIIRKTLSRKTHHKKKDWWSGTRKTKKELRDGDRALNQAWALLRVESGKGLGDFTGLLPL
jgi:hypothetical protein